MKLNKIQKYELAIYLMFVAKYLLAHDVNEYKLIELSDLFLEHEGNAEALEISLHARAAELLKNKNVIEAACTLLAFNN